VNVEAGHQPGRCEFDVFYFWVMSEEVKFMGSGKPMKL
jgi:hypothetical protein